MKKSAPVNVKLEIPTIFIEGWDQDAKRWMTINADIHGHPDFYALTIKAAYIIGIIHTLCQSVNILLADTSSKSVTYLPAYGIFLPVLNCWGVASMEI